MRPRLVDYLTCPKCQGSLNLATRVTDGDEIVEGDLTCAACSTRYPITRSIPRLLPDAASVPDDARRTVDRFGEQWNEFDFITEYYERQFLGWIAPNGPESFRDKVVLEGGCGKGRHSVLAARWGAKEVIAVDLGSAVETAHRNARAFPNVHVVQADLFHLPLAKRSVDVAFSVGVLHHTTSPKAAFLEMVDRVKPGGKMIAWVYGKENNEWILNVVDPVRRGVTSRLPHRALYQISKLPAAVLYAAIHGVYQPLSKRPFDGVGKRLFYQAYLNSLASFPFHEVHSIVHDHLGPPIANYISREDFEDWFRTANLADVQIGWHNENSWRGTGTRRASEAKEPRIDKAAG